MGARVAVVGLSIAVAACGGTSYPTQPLELQASVSAPTPIPAPPTFPPTRRPIEEVIAEGRYTMTIELEQSCALPGSLSPMIYELNVQIGSLPFAALWTSEQRPDSIRGSLNGYSFLKWNTTVQAEDDLDFERCAQSDDISDPPLSICGAGFFYRTSTGYAADIAGGTYIGDRRCGARHHVTLTPRK